MSESSRGYLESTLSEFERVLEIGIGNRTGLAERLNERGIRVFAIDIDPPEMHAGVQVIKADIHSVDPSRFKPLDAVYARRLPPELHRPTARLAEAIACPLFFTTLGGEVPIVPTKTVTGPQETIYVRQPESGSIL